MSHATEASETHPLCKKKTANNVGLSLQELPGPFSAEGYPSSKSFPSNTYAKQGEGGGGVPWGKSLHAVALPILALVESGLRRKDRLSGTSLRRAEDTP